MSVDRPITHAGGAFAEVLAQAGLSQDSLEIVKAAALEAFSPFELFSAGPTPHSQAMVDLIERRKDEYKAQGENIPKQLLADDRVWQKALAIALERDRLSATCAFCLGFGGRGVLLGLTFLTADGRTVSDPAFEGFRDPCACPLGVPLRERIERRRFELLAEDQQRRLRKLWADLRLPEGMGDSITFARHVDQEKMALVQRWYAGEFKAGLVLAGSNQVGKTSTGYLLAQQAIRDGIGVVAMTVPDLIGTLIDTFTRDARLKADLDQPPQTSHQDLIESLQTVPFLLLDDLGTEGQTDYVERALYQILNGRAEANLKTVITTNLKKEEIVTRFGARIYSRIAKLCDRVVLTNRMLGPAAGGLKDLNDLDDA